MDSVLIISLATIASGVVVLSLKLCFKSKCSDIKLCYGAFEVQRNIEMEQRIEDMELHNVSASKSNKDLNATV